MADQINDGGQAFPFHDRHPGMTLRDYFAAKAMQAAYLQWMDDSRKPEEHAKGLADEAYLIADAMIAARTQD